VKGKAGGRAPTEIAVNFLLYQRDRESKKFPYQRKYQQNFFRLTQNAG
jgi:hypothetical protein